MSVAFGLAAFRTGFGQVSHNFVQQILSRLRVAADMSDCPGVLNDFMSALRTVFGFQQNLGMVWTRDDAAAFNAPEFNLTAEISAALFKGFPHAS